MSLTGVTVGLHPLRCGDVLGVLDFAGPPEPAISCGPRMACTGQDLAFTAILPSLQTARILQFASAPHSGRRAEEALSLGGQGLSVGYRAG